MAENGLQARHERQQIVDNFIVCYSIAKHQVGRRSPPNVGNPKVKTPQAFPSKNSHFPRKTHISSKNSRIFEKLKQNFSKNSRNRKVHLQLFAKKRLKKPWYKAIIIDASKTILSDRTIFDRMFSAWMLCVGFRDVLYSLSVFGCRCNKRMKVHLAERF